MGWQTAATPNEGPAIAVLLVAFVALACSGMLSSHLSRTVPPAPDSGSELPYFPSGRFLDLLSLGQPTAIADIASLVPDDIPVEIWDEDLAPRWMDRGGEGRRALYSRLSRRHTAAFFPCCREF